MSNKQEAAEASPRPEAPKILGAEVQMLETDDFTMLFRSFPDDPQRRSWTCNRAVIVYEAELREVIRKEMKGIRDAQPTLIETMFKNAYIDFPMVEEEAKWGVR